MKMVFWAGVGTLFPFLMTTLGAALVFLMKKQSEDGPCMGFAAGVMSAAAVLALGIGVQNLPEGLAVALPFRASGLSRGKSFALGALSGAVEPVFGMLAALMMGAAQSALPGMMAFCAGAMMQVVFAEMIPQAAKTRAGVAGVMAGYTLMMALDLALG